MPLFDEVKLAGRYDIAIMSTNQVDHAAILSSAIAAMAWDVGSPRQRQLGGTSTEA